MDAPAQAPLVEDDPLAHLEERIRRAADLVATLRAERDAALSELETVRKAVAPALAESQKLKVELDSLKSERKHVRTRIEKLLGQMDLL